MTEINYSSLLREIVVDYFEQRLTRVEYLAQRRGLLDRIDHEFNGEDDSTTWPESDITENDITQPNRKGYASSSFPEMDFDTEEPMDDDISTPNDNLDSSKP